MPEILETIAEKLARVRHDGDLALVLVGVEQPLPAVGRLLDLRLAIADADDEPGIGHAELAAWIKGRVLDELWRHVLDVRDLGVIERLKQVGLDHALDKLAARDDDIEAGIARAQLGEELVIGGEQAHIDVDAARLLEGLERRLADIGVPVIEIEFLLFLGPRWRLLAEEADADSCGATSLEKGTA